MSHDPVMSDLDAHLNKIDRDDAIWEAYQDWSQNRTDAEKVEAFSTFIFDTKRCFSGKLVWLGKDGTASAGQASVECYPSEAFEDWDYENNWPGRPDKPIL